MIASNAHSRLLTVFMGAPSLALRLSKSGAVYPYASKQWIAEIRPAAIRPCMNWQAMSFDWNQVRAFLAAAEEGSLSGAARALQSTQPTIGRQISALESSLGVTLLERSVRGLTLTQAGNITGLLAPGPARSLRPLRSIAPQGADWAALCPTAS